MLKSAFVLSALLLSTPSVLAQEWNPEWSDGQIVRQTTTTTTTVIRQNGWNSQALIGTIKVGETALGLVNAGMTKVGIIRAGEILGQSLVGITRVGEITPGLLLHNALSKYLV
jgi:hypothetical protein